MDEEVVENNDLQIPEETCCISHLFVERNSINAFIEIL